MAGAPSPHSVLPGGRDPGCPLSPPTHRKGDTAPRSPQPCPRSPQLPPGCFLQAGRPVLVLPVPARSQHHVLAQQPKSTKRPCPPQPRPSSRCCLISSASPRELLMLLAGSCSYTHPSTSPQAVQHHGAVGTRRSCPGLGEGKRDKQWRSSRRSRRCREDESRLGELGQIFALPPVLTWRQKLPRERQQARPCGMRGSVRSRAEPSPAGSS